VTDDRDAYAVLQVRDDADERVVQAAYRALARRYHPDGEAPQPERMTEINRAYERLRTPDRRARYDQERRHRLVAVGPGTPPAPYDPWARRGAADAPVPASPDVLDFGRYAGWRIADIARRDPDYLRWLSRHSTGIRYLEAIARCLPGEQLGRRTSLVG
jgi:curved DNA-binding protein CbpA